MRTLSASPAVSRLILPWLFSLAYLIHITEEYLGGGALRAAQGTNLNGVDFTASQFLFINSITFLLLLLLIILSQKFKFPEWTLVCLGTIFFINAVSHIAYSVVTAEYNPGLITGLLIFMPLGVLTLVRLRAKMSTRRYLIAMTVGIVIHGIVTFLALRGGHLFRL